MFERSSWSFAHALKGIFSQRVIDESTWEELESTLILADFGPDLSEDIVERLRKQATSLNITDPARVQPALVELLEEQFKRFDPTLHLQNTPAVVVMVGVNGVGKTTTIGKFAHLLKGYDKSVVVGAADTFRAAAVEQLATWSARADADIIRPVHDGQDPASVAFQTVEYAVKEHKDVVLIDTAGRLQTKQSLMDELAKIIRVVEKQVPVAEVLLVLDATTGQNGLSQAEAFIEYSRVTGLVLTKLDGSAKGGFVLAVQEKTGIPVKLVGRGERIQDLTGFTPEVFVRRLVS